MSHEESQKRWKQFLSGDEKAYEWLYLHYTKELLQYGLCITSDAELVKDCIQDLFVYLYVAKPKLQSCKNCRLYIYIAFKNNLFKAISKVSNMDNIDENIPFTLELTVEEQFINNEQYINNSKKVNQLLSLLSPRQREIIYYRFILEMSISEISTLVNINYQSVQNLIQRSLRKMTVTQTRMELMLLLNWSLQQL